MDLFVPTDLTKLSREELLDRLDGINSCIDWASYWFERLSEARTLSEQSGAFVELSNKMHDLKTWHPRYYYETGEIVEQEILEEPGESTAS